MIVGGCVGASVVAVVLAFLVRPEPVEIVDRIQIGMTAQQVDAIYGDTNLAGMTGLCLHEQPTEKGIIRLQFQGGRVSSKIFLESQPTFWERMGRWLGV
jgi:hypothetical protein